jgi:hypothetical protein
MAHRNRGRSAAVVAALITGGLAVVAGPQAQAADWSRCVDGPRDRQAVFARAAEVSGVPETVLLGVSYLESRWDDHGQQVSVSGGYGPMHLTQDAAAAHAAQRAAAKGDGTTVPRVAGTLTQAARLTGMSREALRSDDVANVCGGAAVLASSQPRTTSERPADWSKSVASYAGTVDARERLQFAKQVFTVIRSGEARTTNDGQRVVLPATPDAAVKVSAVDAGGTIPSGNDALDCPRRLACESVPAPYELLGDGTNPGSYGNHDLANRPHQGLSIDYIVIHDTEGSYDTSVKLVEDPGYLGWHYTIRSADGHVAQHINPKNVGFQAGNWYVNMHSIGIEHEGFAAAGAAWYTESMYRSSATLVRYLAREYGVPLNRAHIIGHDQVPGITTANIPGMHWDPGPYWDWEHYMRLLGAPIAHRRDTGAAHRGDVVTVVPGFDGNRQPVTGCDGTAAICPTQGTNFVYLHQAPSADSPLVKDVGTASGVEPVDHRGGRHRRAGGRGTEARRRSPFGSLDRRVVPRRDRLDPQPERRRAQGPPQVDRAAGEDRRRRGGSGVRTRLPRSVRVPSGDPGPGRLSTGLHAQAQAVLRARRRAAADGLLLREDLRQLAAEGPHRRGGQGPLLPDLVRSPDRVCPRRRRDAEARVPDRSLVGTSGATGRKVSRPRPRWRRSGCTSSSNVEENTAAGCPAAAHTSSKPRSALSMYVGTGDGWPMGDTPPITCPVCCRTKSGFARRRAGSPRSAATLPVSTRCAPEVKISTGVPLASNRRLFAIAPTSHPSASAASAAVCTDSGRTTIRPVPPAAASAERKRLIAACSVSFDVMARTLRCRRRG